MNLQNFEILIFLLCFLLKNTKEIGKEIVQKYHENISKFRSFVNSFWSIFMSNKIERSFALAIFFRFSDRRMHLLFPIFPTYAYKSSLEIRHNFMRAVSQLRGCKFPLWHTSNCHEQKVHYLSSNLSIYDFSIQSKAIDVQPFEVWVRNEKNGLFSKLPKRKIYISLRKCDSRKKVFPLKVFGKKWTTTKNAEFSFWKILFSYLEISSGSFCIRSIKSWKFNYNQSPNPP